MSKELPQTLPRPENKGVLDRSGGGVKPYELDPELAQIKIAELMVNKLGTPSVLDKEFAVRFGIFNALNHDYNNKTGYDSSLRMKIYREYAAQSVNEEGLYFRNFWAYMMHPRYIIQAGTMQPLQNEEQKESIAGKIMNWFRGGKKNDTTNQ